MTAASETPRELGLSTVTQVYGSDLGFREILESPPVGAKPFTEETVDHLFADIWTRPGLSVRDRRLLTIGVVAANGRADLAETQFVGALKAGELDAEQLGEVVLQLAYYAGWPNAQAMQRAANAAIRRLDD